MGTKGATWGPQVKGDWGSEVIAVTCRSIFLKRLLRANRGFRLRCFTREHVNVLVFFHNVFIRTSPDLLS